MAGWLKEQWTQIRGNFKYEILRFIVFGGAVTVLGLIVGYGQRLAHHPASSLELILIPFAGLVLMLGYSLYVNKKSGRLNLEVKPSYGPGTQQLLIVTNKGQAGTYSAFCEIIGHPNGVNDFRKGEFRCGWGDGNLPRKFIPSGETENVFIATWKEVIAFELSEMTIWEVVEGKSVAIASFRWSQDHKESLPDFNIKIRIVADYSVDQQTYTCGVGPKTYLGPLRMLIMEETK